ncbi:hypothetical protein MMC07_000989 [Pseudocyphellaria aurata]|nr:hypothetical protein [Pseudocyphellaria aurata]
MALQLELCFDAEMPRVFAIISEEFGHDCEYIETIYPAHATDSAEQLGQNAFSPCDRVTPTPPSSRSPTSPSTKSLVLLNEISTIAGCCRSVFREAGGQYHDGHGISQQATCPSPDVDDIIDESSAAGIGASSGPTPPRVLLCSFARVCVTMLFRWRFGDRWCGSMRLDGMAGGIAVVTLIVQERWEPLAPFLITTLSQYPLILGKLWLRKHGESHMNCDRLTF